MAIFNSNLAQTNKPLTLPLLAFITIFLMLLHRVNSADSLSFTFNSFTKGEKDLIYQGDAVIDTKSKALQLTKFGSTGSVGRALYYAPVHLWKSSGAVASFETTFTFVISSTNVPADGLAFFIATPGTTIPPGANGRLLGLFPNANLRNNSTNNSTLSTNDEIVSFKASSDKVVAVEFDTYSNRDIGDPGDRHIGIDVNSIRSKVTRPWNLQNGATATATISYNAATETLKVFSFYPKTYSPVTLSYKIALNNFLPEWVRIGFSGSTGELTQTNSILSWSFESSFGTSVEKEEAHIASVV